MQHLLDRGFAVRAAARRPERVQALFPLDPPVPQAVTADVHDEAAVAAALAGAYGAVNAVSLYVEHGREMGSDALQADAVETWICSYLSLALLAGVGLHAAFG